MVNGGFHENQISYQRGYNSEFASSVRCGAVIINDIDDIDNQIDNAVNYEEYDMTEDDVEDEVNYLLDQFYDFCDGARVWVELD